MNQIIKLFRLLDPSREGSAYIAMPREKKIKRSSAFYGFKLGNKLAYRRF